MKPQDTIFIVVIIILLIIHKPKATTSIGLIALIMSSLLFAKHIFFTAQHLTYFAAATFLLTVIQYLWEMRHEDRH